MKSEFVIFVKTTKFGANTGEVISSDIWRDSKKFLTKNNQPFRTLYLM